MKYIFLFLLFPFLAYNQNQKGATPIPTQNSSTNFVGDRQLKTQNSTYAVVVGISDYQDKDIPDLRFADKDAEGFANYQKSPGGSNLNIDRLKT